jgi:hypothetical protein
MNLRPWQLVRIWRRVEVLLIGVGFAAIFIAALVLIVVGGVHLLRVIGVL